MQTSSIKHFFLAVISLCLSFSSSADTYTYDALNRLTAVAYAAGGSQKYVYDPAGNLLELLSTPPVMSNYTVSVSLNGAGGGAVTGAGINCGSTCSASLANGASVTLVATAASGSTFDGWGGACVGTGNCVLTMNATQNVTATFTISTPTTALLNVTRSGTGSGGVTSSPGGINCAGNCSASFNTGASVTLTAVPSTGSTFSGWGGDCSGLSACVVAMGSARNVSASFTIAPPDNNLNLPLVLAQGWNLLGNSLMGQPTSVASVFSDPTQVTTVWKWDVATSGWQFYAPSMDAASLQTYVATKGYGVLSMINPGEGYWVNAKAASSHGTQTGLAFNLTAEKLVKGWNLVATGNDVTPAAFNLSLSATPPSAAGTIPLNLTTLWAWDNPASQWYFYAPLLDSNGGLVSYITSKNYLDFTQRSKTLGKGQGFWVNKP